MSMKDLEKAFELENEYFSPEEVSFSGPCSEAAVKNAEIALAIKFPKTYRHFLLVKGSGGVGSDLIFGMGSRDKEFSGPIPEVTAYHVVWSNLDERNRKWHPDFLISIYDLGEGTTYCLDLSQMNKDGECPVVVWPIFGYEATPVLEILAEDFGKFYLDCVEKQLEWKREEEAEKA